MNFISDDVKFEICSSLNLSEKVKFLLYFDFQSKELIKNISRIYFLDCDNLNDFIIESLNLNLTQCLLKSINLGKEDTVNAILLEDDKLFDITQNLINYLLKIYSSDLMASFDSYDFCIEIGEILDRILEISCVKDCDHILNLLYIHGCGDDEVCQFFDMINPNIDICGLCDKYNSIKCAKVIFDNIIDNTSDRNDLEMFFKNQDIIKELRRIDVPPILDI